MLNSQRSGRLRLLKMTLILPALAVFLWSFNVVDEVSYQVVPAQQPSPPPPPPPPPPVPVPEADLKIKIDKNTSDEELSGIAATVKKEHGIQLDYDVDRNELGEITTLKMQYSGNSGNGNITIDGDDAIEEIYLLITDDGRTEFWSGHRHARHADRKEAHRVRTAVREEMRDAARDLRQEEIIIEREARREEMGKRREEMRQRANESRREMVKLREIEREKARSIRGNVRKRHSAQAQDIHEEVIVLGNAPAHSIKVERIQGEKGLAIHNNMTDRDLDELEKKLANEGIDMRYSRVKRNDRGLITRIKLDVTRKGSKRTIVAKSKDGGPIDPVFIDL